MDYVTLNNGVKMPKLGYGVYQTPPEERQATEALIPPRRTATKKESETP